MNIKDHIEAGHYPTDDKGRALVHIGDLGEEGWDGGLATVLATDGSTGEEIVARFPHARACHWSASGRKAWPATHRTERDYVLLPPPPRKVKVTRYAEVRLSDQAVLGYCKGAGLAPRPGMTIVKLTGEYEEPWTDASKAATEA